MQYLSVVGIAIAMGLAAAVPMDNDLLQTRQDLHDRIVRLMSADHIAPGDVITCTVKAVKKITRCFKHKNDGDTTSDHSELDSMSSEEHRLSSEEHLECSEEHGAHSEEHWEDHSLSNDEVFPASVGFPVKCVVKALVGFAKCACKK